MKKNNDCQFEVTVEKLEGECHAGYKAGDTFAFNNLATPANFCGGAYHVMFPALFGLKFGARYPFEKEEGVAHATCPDNGYVTFRIERIDSDGEPT